MINDQKKLIEKEKFLMFEIFNKKVVDFNDTKKKSAKKLDKSIDIVKKYIDEAIKKTNRNASQLVFTQNSKIRKEKNNFT